MEGPCGQYEGNTRIESVYTVARGISGTPLDDSFHLGSTIVNDYGRPFENGFNNYSGVSGYATAGRFALYVRGEFQAAPSATGYSASAGADALRNRPDALLRSSSSRPTAHYRRVQPDHHSSGADRQRPPMDASWRRISPTNS